MLSELPSELVTVILSNLGKRDLKQARLVSKQLELHARPLLFGDITIFGDEKDLVHLPIEKALASSFDNDRNFLHLARRITFTSQFRSKYWKRCPHSRLQRGSTGYFTESGDEESDYESDGESGYEEPTNHELRVNEPRDKDESPKDDSVNPRYPDDDLLEGYDLTKSEQLDVNRYIHWEDDVENRAKITQIKNRVVALLIRCQEGSLLEFNWDLGICCPFPVLGCAGILPQKQRNIESIRIINDGGCYGHGYWLSNFSRLKRLTLIPLTWRYDLNALSGGLKKFAHQLSLLELDCLTLYSKEEPTGSNDFAWDTLGLSVNQKKQIFSSLQRLYLCGVPFEQAEMEMAHAFNWARLQSLHLRFCPGWAEFLHQVMKSGQQIKLTSLTIEPSALSASPGEEVSTISLLLRTFTGLRDLFLSTNETFGTLDIWRAVLNHKATLKTFVHNQRLPDLPDDNDTYGSLDPPDQFLLEPPELPFTPQEMEMIAESPASNPLASLDLEFLGLSISPTKVRYFVSPFSHKKPLELLHIRQCGSHSRLFRKWGASPRYGRPSEATQELAAFGNWAFGEHGISSLKGLAAGDFSYGNRYSNTRYLTLLSLTSPPLDVKFADALAACPQENLFTTVTD